MVGAYGGIVAESQAFVALQHEVSVEPRYFMTAYTAWVCVIDTL